MKASEEFSRAEAGREGDNLPADGLVRLYRKMAIIRSAEERLAEDCANGVLPGPVHLYIGQEAVAAGVCDQLEQSDWISSTHRGHGHFLAKGGELKTLLAEVYGRSGGICRGYGGSMHVADFSKGIMGANGIVGGGLALMAGAALASQLDGSGSVGVCFFGDGAANQGTLMEVLNVASLWKLPLVLICENNGFSEFSPIATVTSGRISDRAFAFNVPGHRIDGNDVIEVRRTAGRAIERARRGDGPSLIEAVTYRLRGHVEYESTFLSEPYRSEDEVDLWRKRDPILQFRKYLVNNDLVNEADLDEADRSIATEIEEAVRYAETSPWPVPGDSAAGLMFSTGAQS